MLAPGYYEEEGAHDVDEGFVDLAVEGFLEQDFVAWVGLDQQIDSPKRSTYGEDHVDHLQHLPIKRFLLGVIDRNFELGLEQVLEQNSGAKLIGGLLVFFAVDDQLLLEVVVLVQIQDDVPKGIDLVRLQQVLLKIAELFLCFLRRLSLLLGLLFVLLLGEPKELASDC